MLHSRLLRYLDEVARSGSIRKAAGRLNVASSAVNRQILALEAELGAPLFERLNRRLRLTATGELLIAHVRQTLKEHARVHALIEDMKGLRRGEVTIATMGGLASAALPRVVAGFRQRHPGVKVVIRILPVNELIAVVAAGEVDLGFAFDLPRHAGLRTFSVQEVRLGAVVAPGHALAGRASVALGDCVVHPLILPDPGVTLRRILDDAFVRAAVTATAAIETNSIELMVRLAQQGVGVTFLNAVNVAEENRHGEVAFVPLRDRHLPPQRLSVVGSAKGKLDPLPSLLVEEINTALRPREEARL